MIVEYELPEVKDPSDLKIKPINFTNIEEFVFLDTSLDGKTLYVD